MLLDKHLKAWILEVNVSPSLSSSSPMDKEIKNALMTDVFHTIGFVRLLCVVEYVCSNQADSTAVLPCAPPQVPYDPKKWEREKEKAKMQRLLGKPHHTTAQPAAPTLRYP